MRKLLSLVIPLTLAFGATACAESNDSSDKPQVLTTFTILADIAKNIAGDRVDVRSITPPGAEIHDYNPSPSDIAAATDADLILANGLGLEHWIDKLLTNTDTKRATVSDGVTPINIEGTDHPNPHAWMSPVVAKVYTDNIVKALSELAPESANEFKANGDEYKKELDKANTTLTEGLAKLPPNKRTLVTCEGAFGYLTHHASMNEGYIWPVNTEREITSNDITRAATFVRQHSVPAVFCESTVEAGPQEQLMRETGAANGGTLYVDSLSPEDGPVPNFLDLIRYDVDTIVAGLNK